MKKYLLPSFIPCHYVKVILKLRMFIFSLTMIFNTSAFCHTSQKLLISSEQYNDEPALLANWQKLDGNRELTLECIQNNKDIVWTQLVDGQSKQTLVPFSSFYSNGDTSVNSLICRLIFRENIFQNIKGGELINRFQVDIKSISNQYVTWDIPPYGFKPASIEITLKSEDYNEEDSDILSGDSEKWAFKNDLQDGEYELSIRLDMNNNYFYKPTVILFNINNEQGSIKERSANQTNSENDNFYNSSAFIVPACLGAMVSSAFFIIGLFARRHCLIPRDREIDSMRYRAFSAIMVSLAVLGIADTFVLFVAGSLSPLNNKILDVSFVFTGATVPSMITALLGFYISETYFYMKEHVMLPDLKDFVGQQ